MELVLAVRQDLAAQGAVPDAVAAITGPADIALAQKFPGATDPSLARWFGATVTDEAQASALAAQLLALDEVDEALVKGDARPSMLPPEVDGEVEAGPAPPTPTPLLEDRQGYLGDLGAGVAWAQPGGKGAGVTVADVESAWELGHEALAGRRLGPVANMVDSHEHRSHGTSALGLLAAAHDGRGITGICPEVEVAVFSVGQDEEAVDSAIYEATQRLQPGDVLLVELERRSGADDGTQRGYLPVEWWPDAFDVIAAATRRGILVVEAAGNGLVDLDAPPPDRERRLAEQVNPFLRGERDSGAILVGAGAPPPARRNDPPARSRLPFSNHGSCVDVQGWGLRVASAGGYRDGPGDLFGGEDPTRWYTGHFNGTSAAAAMVAGVIACVQGILDAAGLRRLTPPEVRHALRETGSPQVAGPEAPLDQRIGTLPDLEALIRCAKQLASSPRNHHLRPQPRKRSMKITITITDGDVTVQDATDQRSSAGSSIDPASVDPAHVKGPSLAIVTKDQKLERIADLDELAQQIARHLREEPPMSTAS